MLSDKVILVTGSSRGLGAYLSGALVRSGARVVGVARDEARLKALGAKLGPAFHGIACDIGESKDIDRVFDQVDKEFGLLNGLINCAAIYDHFLIDNGPAERIERTVRTNLIGPMLCSRAAVALMKRAGGGDIINITSESVRNPFALLTVYAATKAGLENFSVGLRLELRPHKIRVTPLRLGIMDDPERQRVMDEDTMRLFFELNGGALASAGKTMMSLESVSKSIIHMLSLPDDVAYEMVELRPRL